MNKRKNLNDRRKKTRTPFTERRKKKFIDVFSNEIKKVCILKQKKIKLIEQAKNFINHIKQTPRNITTDFLENYLISFSKKDQNIISEMFYFLYCFLYGFYDYDVIFEKYKNELKPKLQYSNYIIDLKNQLKLENKSKDTIKLYKNNLIRLFDFYYPKKTEEINIEDVRNYILYLKDEKNISASLQSSITNAYKYFCRKILNLNIDWKKLPSPKKPKSLPKVISEQEILKFFSVIDNFKYKVIFELIYSAGLRISEAARVKIEHFDFNRKIFMIRNAKGQKDRETILSQKIINEFKKYNELHHPSSWLFYSGNNKNKHINKRSIQKMFNKYKEQSKINNIHTVHSLRHSFATHLVRRIINVCICFIKFKR